MTEWTKSVRDNLSLTEELVYALLEHPHPNLTEFDVQSASWNAYDIRITEDGWAAIICALGRLQDGRWVAVDAWVDYTREGQAEADWLVCDSQADAIMGMTDDMRDLLNIAIPDGEGE